MRGNDVAELRAFAAVCEHRSFTRAAAHLGMSGSALSQVIRTLEERLGTRLLHRTTRSVAPSEAGERLLTGLLPALRDLEAAVLAVSARDGTPAGRLRINSSRLAALHHIAPLIGPFTRAYPGISLDITVDDTLIDIVADGFDAGIRLGESLDRDMVAIRLGGPLRLMAVASPSYCARHGRPTTPHDLLRHRGLNTRWPTDGSPYRWEFERGGEELEIAVPGQVITNEAEILVQAACDGAGIAYLLDRQVEPFIASGQLIHLLADWSPPFPGFHLYYPSRRQMLPALRAFIDFATARDRAGERTPSSG
ncbi:LysR family transcriptional regulator [Bosea sp. CCNWLW174]|uniref:LysR family transcriptional regulator n=1 Tax=unclassified Bosea (in: a-proteobacteria) TaxID=2653178 RepID=UPI00301532D7